MIKNFLILFFVLTMTIPAFSQIVPYRVFDKKGDLIDFEKLIEESVNSEVIFFGELHNNSMVHWLQLQLLKELNNIADNLVFSGEFFERDDQINIDEWFSGLMTDKNFEAEAKLWNNYATDYKPLMLFAKEHQIPFIASNVPRKYASLVSRRGLSSLDSLADEAKLHIAPLPIIVDKNLPGYVKMKEITHGSDMNLDFMIEAQAIKDATMAFSLFDLLSKGNTILHINGAYHTNNYEGIVWYLDKHFPEIKITTISTVEQEDLDSLMKESIGIADYIIVVPKDSHKSF